MDPEPLFRALVTGLVPQPTQMPPAPFPKEALQRIFFDVNEIAPYQQFGFLPADGGAQLINSPADMVMVQTGLFQVATPVTLTAEQAREKTVRILKAIVARLDSHAFLQCGIKVIAHVSAPGPRPDAKAYVAERLMGGANPDELGPHFYAGGVKYRRLDPGREDNLLIEPFIGDETMLYVDYDIQFQQPFQDLEQLPGWLDEAFSFVSGPTMRILEM